MKPSTEHAFAALSDLIPVGVLVLDAAGDPVFASAPACDLLGCAGEDALKSRWTTIAALLCIAPEQLPRTLKPLRRALDIRVGETERYLRVEIGALDTADAGWLVLLKDRKIVHALDASLLQASRMHTRAYLHEALRHDLKTPLNSMQIALELLAGSVADDSGQPPGERLLAQQRYVNVLRDDVTRLNRNLRAAVDQPLVAAVQSFDLGHLLRETADRLESQARRQGIRVQAHLPAETITLHGAEDWLRQALLNIAVYQLETLPGDGRIDIECETHERTATVVLRIDGAGIPEATLDDVYRVAYTPDGNPGLTGLYLARIVVEALGGAFRVETGSGRGRCFRLLLPRTSST